MAGPGDRRGNNAKRVGGKFAVNPNSRAAKKRREKEAREAAAKAGEAAPDNAANPTQKPADSAESAQAVKEESTGNVADKPAAEEPSPVDSWTPPPAQHRPAMSGEVVDDDDEDDDNELGEDGQPKKKLSKKARQKQRYFALKLVEGSDKLFGVYADVRHSYVKQIAAKMMASGDEKTMKQGETLLLLVDIPDEEKDYLADSIARFMEENNIEVSAELELVIMAGSIIGGRVLALEGMRLAMKKGGIQV